MSNNLLENEDYQVVTPSTNGLFTVSHVNGDEDTVEDFQNIDVPLAPVNSNSCFDLNNLPKIYTINELLNHLCELMVRFDGCVSDYQKSDYEHLIKTVSNSLIYLYTTGSSGNITSDSVSFIGVADLNTNPIIDSINLNNKYPGIYFAQTIGEYVNFGITLTETDIFNNIVLLIPNLLEGVFIDYRTEIYSLNITKHFRYSSDTKKVVWEINHNLNKIPTVVITDTAGNSYEGSVKYIDNNNLTITFSAAFKGYADLN